MNFSQIREYTTGLIKKAFSNKQQLDKIGESPSGNLMFGDTEINAAGTIINNTYNGKLSYADIYSAEERIIGCWENNKPIYQKVVKVSFPVVNNTKGTFGQVFSTQSFQEITNLDYEEITVLSINDDLTPHFYSSPSGNSLIGYTIYVNKNANDSNKYYFTLVDVTGWFKSTQLQDTLILKYTKNSDAENLFRPDMLEGATFSQTINYNNTLGYQDWLDTEEKVVGRYIDGKPLYQKTIIYTFTGEEVSSEVYGEKLYSILDISDLLIDTLVDITGSSNNSPIPLLWSTNHYSVNIDSTHLYLTCCPSSLKIEVNTKFIITIKYTKTTDTPDTFDPAMLENVIVDRTYTGEITYESYYNIGERVIGRWIDGKPIYRRLRKYDTPLHASWQDKYTISVDINSDLKCPNFLENADTPISAIVVGYTTWDSVKRKICAPVSARIEDDNWLYINFVANLSSDGFNIEYLCIDYTKTTDAENSFVPSLINNEEETVDIPAAIAADTIILNTYDSETEEQTEP